MTHQRPAARPPAPILVLVSPQDLVNVASAVRIAKNFGIGTVRVINPEVELDAYRIEGIAHNTADVVARMTVHESLADALADCVYAAVLTGRERAAKRSVLRPREAAIRLVERAADGPVALVAGREDSGLTNDELDRCDILVTISTDPGHPSLNLAQAVAIMAHELWLARGGDDLPFKPPRKTAPAATHEILEALFADWERALWAIDFFKTRHPEHVMRSFRELVFRAAPDAREASLLRAMGIEVGRFLAREGVLTRQDASASPSRGPET
ncbi:MAG TPA: TrmH family RNA methyltransferase [Gemmatimonadales bacterium]|jgi:TrmH family RNA methyltransferase|nr:TrmH family RNA methyltransferase [Gemmatimonadales bacterium]